MTTKPADRSPTADLSGREVLVSVTGGIAAYKVCEVVSRLVQRGAGVTVAMTEAAQKFVGPTTFQALSGRRVLTSLWRAHDPSDVQHIAATDQADLLVVAPATADIIARFAAGIADDMVTTLFAANAAPVLLAPAMNDRMWRHPIVQRNIKTLAGLGYHTVGPGEGWLACRSVGAGRMAEADEILERAVEILESSAKKPCD